MDILTQKDTGLFIQFQAGKPSYYLGDCIDLDTIPGPRLGGIDRIFCWNRKRDGFVVRGKKRTPPGGVEFTLGEMMTVARSWLEAAQCPFHVYALRRTCGEAGVFANWDRGAIVGNCEILDDEQANVAHHVDDNEQMHNVNVSGDPPRHDVFTLIASRLSSAQTRGANTIANCDNLFCGDKCGKQTYPCDNFFIGTDGAGGISADVVYSEDGGDTMANATTDPFGVNENIVGSTCFEIRKGVNRWLVTRAAVVADPLEVAYSDNGGDTWTNVNVGATNNEGGTGPKCLFSLDSQHIWLCTSLGNVYFSSDGGVTWIEQTTADDASGGNWLNAIDFVDEMIGFSVGDSDTIITTQDGGNSWTACTAMGSGSNHTSVVTFSQYRAGIGSQDGMYMTFDGGITYEQKTYDGSPDGVIDLSFFNQFSGLMVTSDNIGSVGSTGHIHHTIDGGHSWREIALSQNNGVTAVVMCGENEGYAVGEVEGGTMVVYRIKVQFGESL